MSEKSQRLQSMYESLVQMREEIKAMIDMVEDMMWEED